MVGEHGHELRAATRRMPTSNLFLSHSYKALVRIFHIGSQVAMRFLTDGLDHVGRQFATPSMESGKVKPIAINASLHHLHGVHLNADTQHTAFGGRPMHSR